MTKESLFASFAKGLQTALNSVGENLAVDGVVGPKTLAAASKYTVGVSVKKISEETEQPTVPSETPTKTPYVPYDKLTTGRDPDEGTPPWYRRMFKACAIRPGYEQMVRNAQAKVEAGMPRYLAVAQLFGAKNPQVLAAVIGVVHLKESGCDFAGVLHNGERIIGTGKKTKLVPAGRGPFTSWEQAAVDAIKMKISQWQHIIEGVNDTGVILHVLERFNGTGYITGAGKNDTSPYLWACSNINDGTGLYTSDGKYSQSASTLKSVGAATVLKNLVVDGKLNLTV